MQDMMASISSGIPDTLEILVHSCVLWRKRLYDIDASIVNAITILLIVSKLKGPEIELFPVCVHFGIKFQDVIDNEIVVLERLDWDIIIETPIDLMETVNNRHLRVIVIYVSNFDFGNMSMADIERGTYFFSLKKRLSNNEIRSMSHKALEVYNTLLEAMLSR